MPAVMGYWGGVLGGGKCPVNACHDCKQPRTPS